MHPRLRRECVQVLINADLELVMQNLAFVLAKLPPRRDVGRIHQHRARAFHGSERFLHDFVHTWMKAKELPSHSDTRATQPIRLQKCGVVGDLWNLPGGFVTVIAASNGTEQRCRVSHASRHWPCSVLCVRNWDNTGTAD